MLTMLACRALRYKAAQRLVVHMATAMRRHWRYAPGYAALPLRFGHSIILFLNEITLFIQNYFSIRIYNITLP